MSQEVLEIFEELKLLKDVTAHVPEMQRHIHKFSRLPDEGDFNRIKGRIDMAEKQVAQAKKKQDESEKKIKGILE